MTEDFYVGSDLEALSDLRHYQRWILGDYHGRLRGRVLEVGAGIGNLALQYAADVDEIVLVEPAANLVPLLRERVASIPHARVVEGTVASWLAEEDVSGGFDAILMINVLEHIADDAAELRRLRGLLRPGGALLVFVPACQKLYGSLDALVKHERRYERDALEKVVREAGFEVESMKYFDIAGMVPWWLSGRVLRQKAFNPAMAQLYDRLVVPVMSRVERRLTPPIGKNLTCVALAGGAGM